MRHGIQSNGYKDVQEFSENYNSIKEDVETMKKN